MDFPALFYRWLKSRGLSHSKSMWLAHPCDRVREWLYWRNILMLPWEGHGWEWNTKKNRDRRRIQALGDRYNSANF